MFKSDKKLVFFIIILLFFSFCYGFISHKSKIFPYSVLKHFSNTISPDSINTKNDQILRDKYKNWNNINKNFKPIHKVFLKNYYPGINIYSDRHYYNHVNDNKLKGFGVIQLLKHQSANIELTSYDEIFVYRALCKHNNNNSYKDWEKVDFKILIITHSCIFEKLVKKKFNKGKIILRAGGPKSSDPIFVFNEKEGLKLEIDEPNINIFITPTK